MPRHSLASSLARPELNGRKWMEQNGTKWLKHKEKWNRMERNVTNNKTEQDRNGAFVLCLLYIISDKMSMVGRKTLGQVDRRLHQAFPHHTQKVFGGCLLSSLWRFRPISLSNGSSPVYHHCKYRTVRSRKNSLPDHPTARSGHAPDWSRSSASTVL